VEICSELYIEYSSDVSTIEFESDAISAKAHLQLDLGAILAENKNDTSNEMVLEVYRKKHGQSSFLKYGCTISGTGDFCKADGAFQRKR